MHRSPIHLIVGCLNKKTGHFLSGFACLGAITVIGAGLATLLRTTPESSSTGREEGRT
jgi:hypothetical protein